MAELIRDRKPNCSRQADIQQKTDVDIECIDDYQHLQCFVHDFREKLLLGALRLLVIIIEALANAGDVVRGGDCAEIEKGENSGRNEDDDDVGGHGVRIIGDHVEKEGYVVVVGEHSKVPVGVHYADMVHCL
jgi:hypothetical protein